MTPRVLLLSGMTVDDQYFNRLKPLVPGCEVLPWLPSRPSESLANYVQRLAASSATHSIDFVCGVSFGGIVGLELARHISPDAVFVISSIRHPGQMPTSFRCLRMLGPLLNETGLGVIGQFAAAVPRRLRNSGTHRLRKLGGPEGAWHRWATKAVLHWNPSAVRGSIPVVQIHGECDRTFPLHRISAEYVIAGGGHDLARTHPTELAAIINEEIRQRLAQRGC